MRSNVLKNWRGIVLFIIFFTIFPLIIIFWYIYCYFKINKSIENFKISEENNFNKL